MSFGPMDGKFEAPGVGLDASVKAPDLVDVPHVPNMQKVGDLGQVAKNMATSSMHDAAHTALGKAAAKLDGATDLPFFEEIAVTGANPKKLVGGVVAKAEGAIKGIVGAIARKLGGKNFEVTVGSGDKLEVRHFNVHERLSTLFQVHLVAVSDNPSISFDDVVGQSAKFEMSAGQHDKCWTGICNHFEQVRVETTGVSTYQLTIVPTFWLLTQRKNHRMFQQISEPDIVVKILQEWGIEPKLCIDKGAYKKRKYRVQYAESDFAFINRVLEDAGITYYFEQDGDETKLVLSDAPQANAKRGESLQFMDGTSTKNDIHSEFVTAVRLGQQVRPGKYTMRDHDYRKPPAVKLLSTASNGLAVEEKLERFQYVPGAFLFGADAGEATPSADDKGKTRTDEKEGAVLAQKRLEAKRGAARTATFDTNAHDLAPGVVMSIHGHPNAALGDGKALLVVESSLNGTKDGEWSHHCQVRGTDVPFRPELATPRPKTQGIESATVVGPAGEEIHCDEFGRVRVHFHWDRESKMDDNSSCWIHVSQPWAGAGYGGTNLPRIGQEVLVDFLGGDPDRPVIVGRVYTNLQKTPYKLPDNKTQSGWKSNSTGGTGGYNEIMFEDAKGKELVNMQAEKDLTKLVKHDETVTIGHDRTKTVGHDDTLTVGNNRTRMVGNNETVTIGVDQSVTVGENHTETVGKNQTVTVGEDQTFTVGGNHTTTVSGDQKNTVTGSQFNTVHGQPKEGGFCGSQTTITGKYEMTATDTAFLSAPNEIKLQCKDSSITLTPTTITIEAGGKAKLVLDTEALLEAAGHALVKLNAEALMHSSEAESKVLLNTDALMHSSGGSRVLLDATAVLESNDKAYTKCDANVECKGDKFTVDGNEVGITGHSKAALTGGAITVAAQGANEITGSVVKIN